MISTTAITVLLISVAFAAAFSSLEVLRDLQMTHACTEKQGSTYTVTKDVCAFAYGGVKE